MKHLLKVFKLRFQVLKKDDMATGEALVPFTSRIDEEYVDLLFDMVVPKEDLRKVEGILDFIDVLQRCFAQLLAEIDCDIPVPTILLVEPVSAGDELRNFVLLSNQLPPQRCPERPLLPFLLKAPKLMTSSSGTQTDTADNRYFEYFCYTFDASRPKAMPHDCSLCEKPILITDEFIRLLDCQHLYHRMCLSQHIFGIS